MRIILATIILAAIGYVSYWHIAARSLDTEISATLANNPDLSVAEYDLGGFPHRFDLTLTTPRLRLSDGGLEWHGQVLNIHALSYQPHHMIAVFPPVQMFDLNDRQWTLRSPDARASLVSQRNRSGILDRANLVFEAPELAHQGEAHSADSLRASVNRMVESSEYEMAVDLSGFRPDEALVARIDPNRSLPPMLARSRALATFGFAQPLRLGMPAPEIQDITLTELDVIWGDISVQATGQLQADDAGTLSGQLDLRIGQWEQVVELLVTAGIIAQDTAQMANMLLSSLSDRDSGSLDLPLQVRQSVVSFGPIALGTLPRL